MAHVNDWAPEEDLAVINDRPVEGRSDAQCRTRKAFLKRNYVNVGWGRPRRQAEDSFTADYASKRQK